MITYTQFVGDFPEFSNTAPFPQSAFNYYLRFSCLMLTPVWGGPAAPGDPLEMYDIGTEMFIAHNLVLEAMNNKSVAVGGIPGLTKGVVSSESPGQVTVTYDTNAGIEIDAGHWNLTTYGIRFVGMARLLGAAPMQVGPSGILPPHSGPGWTGLNTWPGYFGS